MRQIYKHYGWRKPRGRMIRWRDGDTVLVAQSPTRVRPFPPGLAEAPFLRGNVYGEPGA